MALPNRTLKTTFTAGPRFGLFQTLRDVQIAGLLGEAGWDFVLVDTEHIAFNPETLHQTVLALRAHGLGAIVRLKDIRRETIQSALETGAEGLLAPMCESADEARQFVDFARYPPVGSRGFHGLTAAASFGRDNAATTIQSANDRILLGVQIETPAGLETCETIAATPGVDLLFLGTGDLSVTLGQAGAGDSPEIRAALERMCAACRQCEKIAGLYSSREALIEHGLSHGVRMFTVGSDAAFLKKAASAGRERWKRAAT